LQQVTQRLESCIREGDTVSRLGGDEFVAMLLDLSEQTIEAAAQTESIGEKILTALSQPYQLDKNLFRCTASIGATLFSGNHPASDELMKQADIAMYQAKKAGRNTLRFFDMQMQENISARVSLESELHNALEFKQFHLHYQIQVDNEHRPLGAEALIRWVHPERGLVSPAHFIPLAEETGLILPIGQWVLETACAQLKKWQQDESTRHLTLAVNVSAKQFHQADFVAQVQSALQHLAVDPKLLKLELTESLLQENIEETIATMNALNEIGVQFSLDDFGTGYSSLQYLKRLPLDQIKIDQSFVRDIATDSSDIAVIRATIAMARSLELDVIAEGVETEEQRQILQNNGCSHFQGYLFGKPVPIDHFVVSLKQS
jgi:EAL domain-containing protein (putative c-di-GMP-specific phosphodiesterase class I)